VFEAVDISLDAQKILSCVFRLKQRGRNYGKTMIINILRGSKSEKIFSAGLDTLSVYGIMADSGAHRVREILDHLIAQGYLRLEEGEYPVVDLTPRSREIISERPSLTMMLPKEKPAPAEPELADRFLDGSPGFRVTKLIGKPDGSSGETRGLPGSGAPVDEALLTRLRDLRRSLAQEGRVPAYIVFTDATLRDMCRKRPLTKTAFLNVTGVGEAKLQKYGEAFIRLIGEHGRGEE
jgi:ATP-dependent DNA helicase RecQ